MTIGQAIALLFGALVVGILLWLEWSSLTAPYDPWDGRDTGVYDWEKQP